MDAAWEAADDIIQRHEIYDPDNSIFNDILEAIRAAEGSASITDPTDDLIAISTGQGPRRDDAMPAAGVVDILAMLDRSIDAVKSIKNYDGGMAAHDFGVIRKAVARMGDSPTKAVAEPAKSNLTQAEVDGLIGEFHAPVAAAPADELIAIAAALSTPPSSPTDAVREALSLTQFAEAIEEKVNERGGDATVAEIVGMVLSALSRPAGEGACTVLDEIAAERRRQDEKWGGPGHDDEHTTGELAIAGAVFAVDAAVSMGSGYTNVHTARELLRQYTPCGHSPADARRNLVKAMAVLCAEVERLDRSAPPSPPPAPVVAPPVAEAPADPVFKRRRTGTVAEKIRALLREGKKPVEVAAQLEITTHYVHVIIYQDRARARKAGVPPQPAPPPAPPRRIALPRAVLTQPPRTQTSPPHPALTPAAATPEEAAFGRAVAEHYPKLLKQARNLTRSADAAADLAQDTVARALEKRELFEPGSNLGAWLATMLRNLFINRHRLTKPMSALDDVAEIDLGARGGGQIDALRKRDLNRAMAQLPESQREVVMLIAVDGDSYEEASEKLGVTVGTVKSRLSRGRAALRLLAGEVVETEDQELGAA